MRSAAAFDSMSIRFRADVRASDAASVRALVLATGFFSAAEIGIAVELVEERLAKGAASGYELLFAERAEGTLGYACFGRIPLTRSSWDLYWIAVHPSSQGHGLGRRLLTMSEEAIAAAAGATVYVDTSSRPQYAPTRAFYLGCGYRVAAELADFYAPGDGKVVFEKRIAARR